MVRQICGREPVHPAPLHSSGASRQVMRAGVKEGSLSSIGRWRAGDTAAVFEPELLVAAVARVREPVHVVREGETGRVGVAFGGVAAFERAPEGAGLPLLGSLPALYPEWLGDRSFCEIHGVRFPLVAGEM